MNELKHVCNMFLIRELVKVTSGEVKVKAKKKKKMETKTKNISSILLWKARDLSVTDT